jgi:hypothetical protein
MSITHTINHLTDEYLIGFIVRMFNETYLLENVEISWDWNINSRHDIASFNNCGIRYWKTIYISNAICLYRWIWLVIILHKILNLKVVTKGFSWKDLPSWKHEILHVTFTTILNIEMYFCIFVGVKITQIKIPQNVVDDFGT